jgi:hypothetical protein
MGAGYNLVHHREIGVTWKQLLAGLVILVLAGIGLYFAISNWVNDPVMGLLMLGCLAGPAVVYAFGYFWCLPDLLRSDSHEPTGTLRQRWSDFSLLSTSIALVVIGIAYVWAIRSNWEYVALMRVLMILVAFFLLLPACVVASDSYFNRMGSGRAVQSGTGWRARVRGAIRTWGNWLLMLLGVQRALVIGAVLVLVSLVLVVEEELFWNSAHKGIQIILGHATWPTANSGWFTTAGSGWLKSDVQLYRGAYGLGLFVAFLALVAVALGRRGHFLRSSRVLAAVTAVVALLEATSMVAVFPSAVRLLIWIVPIVAWWIGTHGDSETQDRVRLALMVFYLPVFFASFGFLVFFTYFGIGVGTFTSGMLLLWWGLVQSGRERVG